MFDTILTVEGISMRPGNPASAENILSIASCLNASRLNCNIIDATTGEVLAHNGWVSPALKESLMA